MSSPTNIYLGVAKRILKYVKGIISEGLNYLQAGSMKLTRYSDSDWAGSLDNMKSTSGQESAIVLLCDNNSAIVIAKNPDKHGRTKHINVKFHAIHEAEKNLLIQMEFCFFDMQVVDLMTKSLSRNKISFLKHELGMSNINLK
ncbi:hypothetical protein J1N35_025793, partial [Gossypium stocksii]